MQKTSKSIIFADPSIANGDIWKLEINKKNKFFLVTSKNLFIIEPAHTEGSCLIDNYLVGSPRLYSISQFDSLLLLVPSLIKNKTNFCDVSDILQESNLSFLNNKDFVKFDKICDVKIHEGLKYVRVNNELYESWINCKLLTLGEKMSSSVGFICNSADIVAAGRKLAIGILMQFLPVDLVLAADSKYNVDQVLNTGRLFFKRNDEDQTNASLKMKSKSLDPHYKKNFSSGQKKSEPPRLAKGQTLLSFIKKK